MTLYYSADTHGFYDTDINGSAMPSDIVEITEPQHTALLAAQAAGCVIESDSEGLPVAVAPLPPTLDEVKAYLCVQVDGAADATYAAIGGDSPGRIAEYQQAKDDATAFKAAGYTGTVPATIACWAQACGWTAQQSCDDILTTAAQWAGALVAIRSSRLIGKGNIRAAADAAAAQSAASAAIANLRTITGG